MATKLQLGIWQKSSFLRVFVVVLLILSGCAVKKVPCLDVEHAWMSSNGDRHELRFPKERELSYLQHYQRELHLTGEDDLLSVDFGVRQIILRPNREMLSIAFDDSESFYQPGNDEKAPLELSVGVGGIESSQYYHVTFEQPASLQNITPTARGELLARTAEWIESNDDIVHRFYFSFDVDEVPYAIDVAFRLKAKSVREIVAPATP